MYIRRLLIGIQLKLKFLGKDNTDFNEKNVLSQKQQQIFGFAKNNF